MERRWGMRKAVEIDVVIDNQPECLLRGQIGNVSVGGLYVRTNPDSLSKNSQIELVLMLQQDGTGTRVYRMAAMVVRLTHDGAGLMFDQYDVNAFRALVVLLLARQKASAAATTDHIHTFTFSIDGDADVASVLEGTAGRAAGAARGFVPTLKQPSPALGE